MRISKHLLASFIFLCLLPSLAFSQERVLLWEKGNMPNSKGLNIKDSISNERLMEVASPYIQVFLTSKQENKRAAVLIIPGGGYHHLAYEISGVTLAKWFNTLGINAFVLAHRLPISKNVNIREITPLQDAQRGMRIIRANAMKWGIDSNKVGVMGSSAGGHLAASLGTIKDDYARANDTMDQLSFRPDFMILVSPVIDMGIFAHKGSRDNLLGPKPSPQLIDKFSLQKQVSSYTPSTFIAQAFNDKSVSAKNSLLFFDALLEKGIPSSLHVFPQGGHSIALRNNPGSTALWVNLCEEWLVESGVISR
ncbi:pectin acetylesterase [Pelobium manganitolerans]|uniref:Pectin acetylesterase n=1 Tax=Pelobium manganitolerans TaxID=1842495 RepID=A0A419S7D9_9SPHI|nr:alpha/beta hydrolase [Pelobium manganitolerans]RKD17149.1 pectin acetylesterase [Pelobium manganitolerans]